MDHIEDIATVEKPKPRKKTSKKVVEDAVHDQEFKTKVCKVIKYDERTKMLFLVFDGYGIAIRDVESFDGLDNVSVKYTGEIGSADFKCNL